MKARHEFETDEEYTTYLRTYFAGLAMQGRMANSQMTQGHSPTEEYISYAVELADVLIAELNKRPADDAK